MGTSIKAFASIPGLLLPHAGYLLLAQNYSVCLGYVMEQNIEISHPSVALS